MLDKLKTNWKKTKISIILNLDEKCVILLYLIIRFNTGQQLDAV